MSGRHLLATKRAANRPQHQSDIAFLEELERLGKLDQGSARRLPKRPSWSRGCAPAGECSAIQDGPDLAGNRRGVNPVAGEQLL
ncbi:MAG: hypothetical protein N2378_03075, partial [Chloroflexaceae bacterium]|nr:hypothetical protein [Chloroflexaceae bacterium]